MSYQALYRKFRPNTFDEVKGQDHIVTTLKNQINADRIGHAFLFCGTRGTGKTSVAKILARAVNCENPQDGSPCGECETCKTSAGGSAPNIIEMDAASNNGVDDVRQIIEEIQYSPTVGKYTVYIIDEVHMLSGPAFNALLKTLEEPPAYVIFILATTEPHKIPVTILSRCQRYDFKRISIETIVDRLKELMDKEGISVDEKALRYIAKVADGSMRDALSLLDQCIAFYADKELTYENVLEVLGAVDQEVFSRLTRCIIQGDVTSSMKILDEVVIKGRELGQFVNDFIWYLRNLMLVKGSEDAMEVIDAPLERIEALKQEAEMVDNETIMRYIRVLSETSAQIKYSDQKRVLLEIALIKLNTPAMETDHESLINRISVLENKIESGNIKVDAKPVRRANAEVVSNGNPVPEEPKEDTPVEEPVKEESVEKAVPEDVQYVADNWNMILNHMSPLEKASYKRVSLAVKGEDTLLIVFDADDIMYDKCNTIETIEMINNIIKEQIEKDVQIEMTQKKDNQNEDYFQMITSKMNIEVEEEDF
ncbi:MAG: DNA polymerase III subunit gamma/tau [Eubacterium sp.]|nr:DNA polymerase III subunit gamma/tau [Eubacterium sp.]